MARNVGDVPLPDPELACRGIKGLQVFLNLPDILYLIHTSRLPPETTLETIMRSALYSLALAGAVAASPIARQNWEIPSYINVTYQSPINESLPSVFILATGGTIAGSGASSTDSGRYSAGAIGVAALVEVSSSYRSKTT